MNISAGVLCLLSLHPIFFQGGVRFLNSDLDLNFEFGISYVYTTVSIPLVFI